MVRRLRAEGARLAAYGAAAKGTTLLSYCGLDREVIDYVVDRNAFKQGRYMPGSRLPILAPEKLLEDRPDCTLLAALELRRGDPRAAGRVSRARRPLHHPDPRAAHRVSEPCRRLSGVPSMTDPAATAHLCPSCGSRAERPFYEVAGVPVHQVKLVRTRDEALGCARGDIGLCFCPSCGFVWNAAFDPARMRYEEDYESTQAVSPTFNAFHERLARDVIERFDLHGKGVVEIGCGQGEFLTMLAELGGNAGSASIRCSATRASAKVSSSRTSTPSPMATCARTSSAAR